MFFSVKITLFERKQESVRLQNSISLLVDAIYLIISSGKSCTVYPVLY